MTSNNISQSKQTMAKRSFRVALKRLLKRVQYFLMRYSIPLNSQERRAFRDGSRIFANSIPKSGTNLLKRILHLTPCTAPRWTYQIDQSCLDLFRQVRRTRRGQLITAHLGWSGGLSELLKQEEFCTFLMVRDLRDIAVSAAFYIGGKDKSHRLHTYFKCLKSDAERLTASIVGIEGHLLRDGIRSKSIGEHADSYLSWLDEPDCLVLRFEDLIGDKGGGDDNKQLETVRAVVQHLGLSLTNGQVRNIAQNAFSTTARTFRKGIIGDWRNHFTEKHKKQFKETAGEALIKMGYEDDFEW